MLTRPKYTKILKIAVCLFIATTAIFLLGNFVLAAGVDTGINYAQGTGLSNTQDIRVTIAKIIRIIIGFLGIIAVGLVMYAGWLWMTSEGNEEKIEQAKKTLTNAVIGLIIIISAFAIVSFILNVLGGGSGGPGGGQKITPPKTYGLSALGNGIIESHYPAPNQKEVPRNTSIIITFREEMLASTICKPKAATPDICNDDDINEAVVRIFKKDEAEKCADKYSSSSGCSSLVGAKVYSDGKNYVFVPTNYLGSPSEYIGYMVYLNKDLKRKSGELAFPGLEKEYAWIFEVSNKIDLTPPKVISNEVIPAPDNVRDSTVGVNAAGRAAGSITVNSRPSINRDASALIAGQSTGSPAAGVEINKNCQRDGNFIIAVTTGPIATLYQGSVNLGQGTFSSKAGGYKQAVFSECNLTLVFSQIADNFEAGNSWNITINKATTADTITVGNITYTASSTQSLAQLNFKAGPTDTNARIAQSINNVLINNPVADAAINGSNIVTVTAKIAGVAGNSIVLSSSSSTALQIIAMKDGTDKVENVVVNGAKDQPMNVAIQIVFDEAIMPLVVSGMADDLKNYIRVVNADANVDKINEVACTADTECMSHKCDNNKCVGSVLAGKFEVSNQYRTVNFLSDNECGFNACGEKIYCLPANSHLRVELKAASLIPCTGDDKCQAYSPFNNCKARYTGDANNFCSYTENSVDIFYPQAKKGGSRIVDGIIDPAFNSLDGNRDDSAFGPVSFYNENTPVTTEGDSYKWSFFITDKLDLTPPKINITTPVKDNATANETAPITISFSKLMLSSRLSTGSLIITNGKENIQHYLLNVRSFVDQPLGYWVTNIGRPNSSGVLESTDAYINHTPFSKASTYKAQAGSGLKDIYQNCYLPCDGPACPGDAVNNTVTSGEPCCCDGKIGASCP